MARSPFRTLLFCGAAASALWVIFFPSMLHLSRPFSYSSSPSTGNTAGHGIRSTSSDTARLGQLKQTTFLAHQPGFSVIENLYWFNYTFFFLTDQPWHIPALEKVAQFSTDSSKPTNGHVAAKIWAIRNPPVSPEVKEQNQIGTTISLDDAIPMFGSAEVLDSPMFINNDDNFVSHFYHWIGETFLGSWRVWSHYAWRSGLTLPNVKTVAFIKQYNRAEAPSGSNGGNWWEDGPGANRWFTEKFFPGVKFESRTTWTARAESENLFLVPLAVIADRRGGHAGPSSAWKPWGDVLRLPVSSDWLVNLRERVLAGYKGPVSRHKGNKLKVVYLERQNTGRELVPEDHAALVEALVQLDEEGVADVSVVTFSSEMGFDDQVATMSTVDVLVSVHGNGLTHTLWMSPGPRAAVFEIQPAECTITDYSPLAIAAGVQHYMVHETSYCLPENCPKRQCPGPRGINRNNIRVSPHVIVNEIRRIAASAP